MFPNHSQKQSYIDLWHEFCFECQKLSPAENLSPIPLKKAFQSLSDKSLTLVDVDAVDGHEPNNGDDDDDSVFSSGLPLKANVTISPTTDRKTREALLSLQQMDMSRYMDHSQNYVWILKSALTNLDQLFINRTLHVTNYQNDSSRSDEYGDNNNDSSSSSSSSSRSGQDDDQVQSCWITLSNHRVRDELEQIMYQLSSAYYQLFHEYYNYDDREVEHAQFMLQEAENDNYDDNNENEDDEDVMYNTQQDWLCKNKNYQYGMKTSEMSKYGYSSGSESDGEEMDYLGYTMMDQSIVMDDVDVAEFFADYTLSTNSKKEKTKFEKYEQLMKSVQTTIQVLSSLGWLFYGVYCAHYRYKRRKRHDERILSLTRQQNIDASMIPHQFEIFESSMTFLGVFSELYRIHRIVTSFWWNGGMVGVLNWLVVKWILRKLAPISLKWSLKYLEQENRENDEQEEMKRPSLAPIITSPNVKRTPTIQRITPRKPKKIVKICTSDFVIPCQRSGMTITNPVASDLECVSESKESDSLKTALIRVMDMLRRQKLCRERIECQLRNLNDKQLYVNCPKPLSLTPKKTSWKREHVSWEQAEKCSRNLNTEITNLFQQHFT